MCFKICIFLFHFLTVVLFGHLLKTSGKNICFEFGYSSREQSEENVYLSAYRKITKSRSHPGERQDCRKGNRGLAEGIQTAKRRNHRTQRFGKYREEKVLSHCRRGLLGGPLGRSTKFMFFNLILRVDIYP